MSYEDPALQAKIESIAYRFYQEEGCPEGRALEHWLRAQQEAQDEAFLRQELLTEEAEGGLVGAT